KNHRLAFSPIRKLTPFAESAKRRGVKIYHLNIGQPDIASPDIFLTKVKEFDQKVIAYENSDGTDAFKLSLLKYYQQFNLPVNLDDIVTTTGGSEALWMVFAILFNPGDECLCFEPTYTNYLTFAGLSEVNLKGVPTYLADNFMLPPVASLEKLLTPKTKAVLVTNPSNPTGAVYPENLLADLVEFCLRRDLFIITDETYREFIYGQMTTRSLLSFKIAEQNVVLTDSLSKRYSLCGARLGCLVSKNKSVVEMANKIAQARLSSPSIEQYAASFLGDVPNSYFSKIRAEYQTRRDTLVAGLEKIPSVKVNHPQGAFYLIAELPVKNSEAFCKFMLEKFSDNQETVMLAPAEGFYLTPGLGKNQVRIAYVLNRQDLKRAVELISLGLLKYQDE
ncbi:MAG: pyridoxal phosphate-dependent aminotransferase, partial [Patescibacteria group bacterium]|nr:pyridoxal phosphate-dependent aminotransferase [Patescibacteria group bacterium]